LKFLDRFTKNTHSTWGRRVVTRRRTDRHDEADGRFSQSGKLAEKLDILRNAQSEQALGVHKKNFDCIVLTLSVPEVPLHVTA
jgi:hypothetical protein